MEYRQNIIKDNLEEYSDNFFLENIGITKREYMDGLKDYLIEINRDYFFQKEVSKVDIFNEIIGRYLCNKISLETTDLKVIKKNIITYKIITPNYRSNKYIYFKPEDNFEYGQYVEHFNDRYFKNLEEIHKEDLFKLLAVDLMMEQEDRYARNMEEYYPNNTIRLAPIIDFELAFYNQRRFTYFNPYILIRKDVRILDSFYDKYPEGYNYFAKIFKTGTNELIDHVKDEYNLETKRLVKKEIRCTVRRNHNILRELQG